MHEYYLDGEEKFGIFTSFLYSLAIKIPIFRSFYKFVEEDMLKSGAKIILDVGTGPGNIPIALSHGKFKEIYSVDPSKDMIRIAQSGSREIKNIHFALGSSRNIPFKRKFNIIYTALSYHHWQRKAESLKYLSTFLERNGEIRIYEADAKRIHEAHRFITSSHALDKEELYKTVEKAGLKISKIYEKGVLVRVSIKKKHQ